MSREEFRNEKLYQTTMHLARKMLSEGIISDPCCGTGGFLTESFKYIKDYCKVHHPELNTIDLASEIMIGYDINSNNIGRTRINMTLAGDGFSDIKRLNSLTSPDVAMNVDYIMTNVPYGKGDIAIHDSNSNDEFLKANNNKRLELNFVIKVIQMLKKGGKASVIVPEGLLEAPTLAQFRSYLFKQCKVNTIISLPKFAFVPYTKWKTYVIFLEKRIHPLKNREEVFAKNEKIWAYIVDNDGFANSDKRFPTSLQAKNGAWLHNELQEYIDENGVKQSSLIEQRYEANMDDITLSYMNEWNQEMNGKKYGYISMEEISKKKTIKYTALSVVSVNALLKSEAECHEKLSDENYKALVAFISKKSGKYSVKKEHYIVEGALREEMVPVFDEMEIEYDGENDKFYDISGKETVYALPLVPEKYFRKTVHETICLEQLVKSVDNIEKELCVLFGGINEDK